MACNEVGVVVVFGDAEPWFVILGLSDERALSASSAVPLETLLLRMQRSGVSEGLRE